MTIRLSVLVFALLLPAAHAQIVQETTAFGPYVFTVTRVRDGDTLEGIAYVFPGQMQVFAVRVRGIDTPELKSNSPCEKDLAKEAMTFTAAKLQAAGNIWIDNVSIGSFAGRYIADVWYTLGGTQENLGEALLSSGHARIYKAYDRGQKPRWCVDA